MSRAFVYGLWGSPDLTPRRAKILVEILRWRGRKLKPEPWDVYVYGENNRDWLASRDIPCTMLHPDPLVDFYGVGGPPEPWGKGQMVWGDCCVWRHKTGIMQAAMKRYRAIVWLDWDTLLMEALPANFWPKMARRRPIQMSLVQYRRSHCHWRATRAARKTVPEGAFIYCGDRRIMSRVNAKYAKHRAFVDQTVFAIMMDEMVGGWPGQDGYKAAGFEPYCHRIYSQVHEPDATIFATGGRIKHETWERRYAERHRELVGDLPPS
ncbi:MAG: hypothetical protein ACYTG0_25115 [Planctomycetota bacterium]|jgi:hypothetical protein